MKNILFIICIIFFYPVTAFSQIVPLSSCTYQSSDLWIKLVVLCPEGEVNCDKVIYICLNKNTGDFIHLQGKAVSSKRTYNFLYYEFINNDTKYVIDRYNTLNVIKDNKTILSRKLELCQ